MRLRITAGGEEHDAYVHNLDYAKGGGHVIATASFIQQNKEAGEEEQEIAPRGSDQNPIPYFLFILFKY